MSLVCASIHFCLEIRIRIIIRILRGQRKLWLHHQNITRTTEYFLWNKVLSHCDDLTFTFKEIDFPGNK